jgi:hypothetical protein
MQHDVPKVGPTRGTFLVTDSEPFHFVTYTEFKPCEVGPCHHGMARPQVADGETASDMEGSCE